MALKELDLQDQEQLDHLKAFWKQYGNIISIILIVIFGSLAAYRGWGMWQARQGEQAAAMFDELEKATQAGDAAKTERAFNDMKERFASTSYASQAGLLAAKTLYDKGQADKAGAALQWVVDQGSDESLKTIAKIRQAGLLAEAKKYDEALKLVQNVSKEFEPLAADRRGDILLAQGKKDEAKVAFKAAHTAMEERDDYRRIVEAKLNALGVDVSEKIADKTPEKPDEKQKTAEKK